MRKEDRVLGPYAERDCFRLVIITGGVRRSEYVDTKEEAESRKAQIERKLVKGNGVKVGALIEEYLLRKEVSGDSLPATCREQKGRMYLSLIHISEPTRPY